MMKKRKQQSSGASRGRSKKSYGSFSDLKKQVDKVNAKAQSIVSKMANDPNTSLPDFHKNYNKVKQAFEIMNTAIELGERMKKLKEGK
ncbi:MAG: hypothetical protein WBB36_11710 [Chitinophagales bacterium]